MSFFIIRGTLKTLSPKEKNLLRTQYGITEYSYIPSIYGNVAKSHCVYVKQVKVQPNPDPNNNPNPDPDPLILSYDVSNGMWQVKSPDAQSPALATLECSQEEQLQVVTKNTKWSVFDPSTASYNSSQTITATLTPVSENVDFFLKFGLNLDVFSNYCRRDTMFSVVMNILMAPTI